MDTSRQEYRDALARLRVLREQSGLTLKKVEEVSRGRWKAGAVGSYERGSRHLTLERAFELLDFYGAQISALAPSSFDENFRATIDLRRLRAFESADKFTQVIKNLVQNLKSKRGDWNTEVASIRNSDIQALQAATGYLDQSFFNALEIRGLLVPRKT